MKTTFAKETDLCAAFIKCLPVGWLAYPETGGFDILLVRARDGIQIGVEAKLRLNAKVICQAAESLSIHSTVSPAPDYRAVLIPGGSYDLAALCPLLGITAISMQELFATESGEPEWFDKRRSMARLASGGYSHPFSPHLPEGGKYSDGGWFERCPVKRIPVPDWVPDVAAGASAPVALTPWKVGAIKLVITLSRRGYLTRQDFKHFDVSMSRWTQERWLVKDGNGGWIAGDRMPNFKAQHPTNYGEIEADFEKWKAPETATQRGLFATTDAA